MEPSFLNYGSQSYFNTPMHREHQRAGHTLPGMLTTSPVEFRSSLHGIRREPAILFPPRETNNHNKDLSRRSIT